ncbi:MAG TPA: toll/interleukin-1 receptor domain-containing protein [Terriglobales bacterium]|nr:toll/interleukin-1 receptor domain-containing protein [Terriglobales bacterium]
MKLIGQPETYSDILERVFVTTLLAGFVCTAVLGAFSPQVAAFLNSIDTEAELGLIKNLKVLYVAVPLLVAMSSRLIKLHDRVSDILRLRYTIDTRWILIPLAEGVGVNPDPAQRDAIRENRRNLMYSVFYPYVSLPDSVIDRQRVRSALDNLGWLWVFIEASVVCILSTLIAYYIGAHGAVEVIALLSVLATVGGVGFWLACMRTTTAEVDAILIDNGRRGEIRGHFECLWNPTVSMSGSSTRKQSAGSQPTHDVFISHASEDKDAIARPLYDALTAKGVSVWFDEVTLELGDSLRRKIDEGLAHCRYGIVVLSPTFLAKEWPQRELDGLVARETDSGEKAILPIWHNLDRSTLLLYSAPLADRLAARSTEGVPSIVQKILKVIKRPYES